MRRPLAGRKQRPDPQKSLVGFIVGDIRYAVPISSVREIINPIELTALPHLPRAIAGVADHRGEVIPVVDLRARFDLPPMGFDGRQKWIVVEIGGMRVGLVVDSVTDVFGTGGADLRPAPALGGGEDARGIVGVTSHEGVLVFVLDVDSLEGLTREVQRLAMAMGADDA